ncbi:MAG: 4Fe-4S binding protein [Acetivibrionales bacterium]|jgi:formate dehydrogenase subunit beta
MGFEQQRNELIKICRDLLCEGRVELILGFAQGETPDISIPLFIRDVKDADSLKWDSKCNSNLAKYLTEKKQGVAIIAKPCDARAIVMYMAENQINREDIYIIGVECMGMTEEDGSAAPGCDTCAVKTPPVYDVLVKAGSEDKQEKMSESEAIKPGRMKDKIERFQNEMKKCILCFSCRQACYACYCETCFVDRGIPDWLPSDIDIGTKMVFHLGRAMHLAGRCVGCGACEKACPSGVNIRYLVQDLADFCQELYGYQPGVDPDEVPAMTAFDSNDREVGFLGGEDDESCCGTKKPD